MANGFFFSLTNLKKRERESGRVGLHEGFFFSFFILLLQWVWSEKDGEEEENETAPENYSQ